MTFYPVKYRGFIIPTLKGIKRNKRIKPNGSLQSSCYTPMIHGTARPRRGAIPSAAGASFVPSSVRRSHDGSGLRGDAVGPLASFVRSGALGVLRPDHGKGVHHGQGSEAPPSSHGGGGPSSSIFVLHGKNNRRRSHDRAGVPLPHRRKGVHHGRGTAERIAGRASIMNRKGVHHGRRARPRRWERVPFLRWFIAGRASIMGRASPPIGRRSWASFVSSPPSPEAGRWGGPSSRSYARRLKRGRDGNKKGRRRNLPRRPRLSCLRSSHLIRLTRRILNASAMRSGVRVVSSVMN